MPEPAPAVVSEAPKIDEQIAEQIYEPIRDWLHLASPSRDGLFPATLISHIKKIVAREFKMEVLEMISERRNKEAIIPRHVAMYLCRTISPLSYPSIGRKFHRDHTTIMSGVKMTLKRMIADKDLCQRVALLQCKLEADLAKWRASV